MIGQDIVVVVVIWQESSAVWSQIYIGMHNPKVVQLVLTNH